MHTKHFDLTGPSCPTPHSSCCPPNCIFTQAGMCGGNTAAADADAFWQRLRRGCSLVPPVVEVAGLGPTALPPQHLFTIYVHAPPEYQGVLLAGSEAAAL